MDVGRCKGAFPSFYFKLATGTCEPFQYSGCGGNANRFQTKKQCEDLCLHPSGVKSEPFPASARDQTVEQLISIPDGKQYLFVFFSFFEVR